jgi:hypothetical protein
VINQNCAVFASDSRILFENNKAIASDTYEKIVQVTKYVMVQMAGNATIEGKSFKTIIQDFQKEYGISNTSPIYVDSLVSLFGKYKMSEKDKGIDLFSTIVNFAGIDSDGNSFAYTFGKKDTLRDDLPNPCVYPWGSSKRIIFRLAQGIDPKLSGEIEMLISENMIDSIKDGVVEKFTFIKNKYSLVSNEDLNHWSIRDAVYYAYFIVKSTIVLDRMFAGKYKSDDERKNPHTGGDILLCVVTRDGVKWILPPDYSVDFGQEIDSLIEEL